MSSLPSSSTILLTGGSGFIGTNLIHFLLQRYLDTTVINYDALTYASNRGANTLHEQNPNYRFVNGDIRDMQYLIDTITSTRPDCVINLAAESHVDRSIADASPFISTNIGGVHNLLELCRKHDIPRFIQISTDEVYGTLGPEGVFTEENPLMPRSPYAASKAGADLLTLAWHETYGLPVTITRCTNNYGPWQHSEKLIPLTITRLIRKDPVPVYGAGTNVRDWIHVSDHCSGIAAVMERGRSGEVYNIGSRNEWTNLDLVRVIIRVIRDMTGDTGVSEDLITFVPDRPGHDFRYAIDAGKIELELGWRAVIPFETGIRETVRWYLDKVQSPSPSL